MAQKKQPAGGSAAAGSLPSAELTITPSSEIVVPYLPEAQQFTLNAAIHPRRDIPPVPPGAATTDPNPSPATAFELPGAVPESTGARALTDEVVLVRNTSLTSAATHSTTSNVGEPSVASNGQIVFYTGNWYGAVSLDGGATFQYVNPFQAFPDPPGIGFCCDQVVQYIPKINTFVWLLQYSSGATGENIQRLAFATSADVRLGHWRTYDITPQSLGLPGTFLDFPDLAVGTNMLYMTTNVFTGNTWTATAIVRLPLSGIQSNHITAQRAVSQHNFNFRVAQHCSTRAFWASHEDTSTLRVFSWDEAAAQPTFRDLSVASWSRQPYNSPTPDGHNWLGRADPRIVGATKAGTELWFAWGSGSGGANNRPHPYIQIARINSTNFSVLDNMNIWDPAAATCYPALATNSNGEVGASYMIGGGGRFPTHVVAMLTGTRKDVIVSAGEHGPTDNKWGDYLTIRRHQPKARLFSATGYTLQTSGLNKATPHYVLFGRSSEV